ncbi:MAG: type II toxin-antitoxin system CcdA family antitoxin [Rhodospirillales bacterium]
MPARVHAQVTLDADLFDQARAQRLDLSATLEDRLRQLLAGTRGATWRAENEGAIADANAFLARHGLWSDDKRLF